RDPDRRVARGRRSDRSAAPHACASGPDAGALARGAEERGPAPRAAVPRRSAPEEPRRRCRATGFVARAQIGPMTAPSVDRAGRCRVCGEALVAQARFCGACGAETMEVHLEARRAARAADARDHRTAAALGIAFGG